MRTVDLLDSGKAILGFVLSSNSVSKRSPLVLQSLKKWNIPQDASDSLIYIIASKHLHKNTYSQHPPSLVTVVTDLDLMSNDSNR